MMLGVVFSNLYRLNIMITRLLFSFVFLSFLLFSSEIFGQVTLNQNGTIQLTQSAPSGARPDISFNFSDRSAKIELGLLGGLDFFVEGTRAISITNVGDVGIGNFGTNPAPASIRSKLDVDGQITASNGFASSEGSALTPGFGFFTNGDTPSNSIDWQYSLPPKNLKVTGFT